MNIFDETPAVSITQLRSQLAKHFVPSPCGWRLRTWWIFLNLNENLLGFHRWYIKSKQKMSTTSAAADMDIEEIQVGIKNDKHGLPWVEKY